LIEVNKHGASRGKDKPRYLFNLRRRQATAQNCRQAVGL
jgi:hypothetical protein